MPNTELGIVPDKLPAVSVLVVYNTVPPVPNATLDPSVPVNVRVLLAVRVLPSAIVNIEPVAGGVIVTLLIEVAEATPSVGVTRVGLVASTTLPLPVTALTCVPLILNTLPVPAVSNVLFVKVVVLDAVI